MRFQIIFLLLQIANNINPIGDFMKIAILSSLFFASFIANANITHTFQDQLFMGNEMINERPTGNVCYVKIDSLIDRQEKGLHCKDFTVQFLMTNQNYNITKEPVLVQSRVTNIHDASTYPKFKTCGELTSNAPIGTSRFDNNTQDLYIQIASGETRVGRTQYHWHLSFSDETKLPIRSRVHVLSWFKEVDIDCVNLKPLN